MKRANRMAANHVPNNLGPWYILLITAHNHFVIHELNLTNPKKILKEHNEREKERRRNLIRFASVSVQSSYENVFIMFMLLVLMFVAILSVGFTLIIQGFITSCYVGLLLVIMFEITFQSRFNLWLLLWR